MLGMFILIWVHFHAESKYGNGGYSVQKTLWGCAANMGGKISLLVYNGYRYINLNTKMKFYNACVLYTLLYGAEYWSLTERDEARLDAFDMRCQRKILQITWLQHKTNHYVRSLTKQPQLTNIIRNRRLKWFGHVLRMDPGRIPRTLYLWDPTHGKRKRGRPRTMWKDVIQRDLKTLGFDWSVEEAEVATQDRALWRFLVGQAASAEMHDANG